MIEIQNLNKNYGSIKALKDVTFSVEKGEILGFLGPNGAGKSTAMNIITGYISSTSGVVKVCGYDIIEQPREVKKRIGYLPENPPLYMEMTVIDYLKFVAELKEVAKKEQINQIDKVLNLTKISDHSGRVIKNLSKGYKQRVGLAQALIGNPEVLVLDEPTVGLDPNQIIEIRKVIKGLGREHTIILSSHILPEVSAVCERLVIIDKGRIVAVDTTENLSASLSDKAKYIFKISGPKLPVSKVLESTNGVRTVKVLVKKEPNVYEYEVESEKGIDIRKSLFFELAKAGYPILETRTTELSLEDIFRKLTMANENIEKGGK